MTDENISLASTEGAASPAADEKATVPAADKHAKAADEKANPKFLRALILAGGGAKGAYSFGCLKAFKEKGILFSSVSGTSVGALNAVLWASGRLQEGEKLWKEIDYSNVYPTSFPKLNVYSNSLLRAIATCYVILRLIRASSQGLPVPRRILWIAFAAFAPAAPMWFTILPQLYHHLPDPLVFPAWQCLFSIIFLYPIAFFGLLNRRRNGRSSFLAAQYMGWAMALAFIFPESWVAWPLAIFGPIGAIFATRAICDKIFADNVAILSQSALAKTVSETVASGLHIYTMVTTAKEAKIFDPDNPKWATDEFRTIAVGDTVIFQEPANTWHYPDVRTEWIPGYVRIDNLSPDEAAELCLASAALPFGIVPPRRFHNHHYCDGGVIDNCPVFPFLNTNFDEIYVLLLEPCKSEEKAKRKIGIDAEKWKQRDRTLRLAEFPRPKDVHTKLFGGDKFIRRYP
jgi:predicted acylesterase/phospholipase RssA